MNIKDLEELIQSPVAYVDRIWNKENKTVTWEVEGYKDRVKHCVTVPYKLLTRQQAMELTQSDYAKIRNYDLEMELHQLDIRYFIYELCPFNGFSSVPQEIVNEY